MPFKVRSWHVTDVGMVREQNEDAGYADPHGRFFICSDGMGGHSAGAIASQMAVQMISSQLRDWPMELRQFEANPSPETQRGALGVIDMALRQANSVIHQRGRTERDKHGMGCTCDVLVIAADRALSGHVGDSRQYLIRGGQIQQITTDHSFAPPALPGQAQQKGKLTSALGPNPSCKVDTLAIDLHLGDRLLMCTDGLADYFPDPRELVAILAERGDEYGVRTMIDLAKQRGGADNITIVLCRTEPPEVAAQIERAQQPTMVGPKNRQQAPQGAVLMPGGGAMPMPQSRPAPPGAVLPHAQPQAQAPAPAQATPRNVRETSVGRPALRAGAGVDATDPAIPVIKDAGHRQTAATPASKAKTASAGATASGAIDPPLGARARVVVDKIGIFKNSALFNAVPTDAIVSLLSGTTEIQLMANAPVPRNPKNVDTAWFIMDGEHKGELLYPEALIAPQGEWGDLDTPPENMTAVALTRPDFAKFCTNNAEAGVKLLQNVSRLIVADLRGRPKSNE